MLYHNGITNVPTTAKTPKANSICKRMHQTVVGNTVFAGSQSLGICENKKDGLCKTELTAIQTSTINSD